MASRRHDRILWTDVGAFCSAVCVQWKLFLTVQPFTCSGPDNLIVRDSIVQRSCCRAYSSEGGSCAEATGRLHPTASGMLQVWKCEKAKGCANVDTPSQDSRKGASASASAKLGEAEVGPSIFQSPRYLLTERSPMKQIRRSRIGFNIG